MKFSKEEVLKILEDAKDVQGNVPFAIVKKAIEKLKVEPEWIPCSERLPEETESIFAKFYGTDKWCSSMMRKRSKRVIVTVEYPDGERQTDVASTSDGRWVDSVSVVKRKVLAWMPLPPIYKGESSDT